MTAAQREALEDLMAQYRAGTIPHDALRAALGTCGTCQHAAARVDGGLWCSPPIEAAGFPFRYQDMPDGERCTGWTAKSDQ